MEKEIKVDISSRDELLEKYSKQLELYKKTLEEALNKKVSKIYIYSTCLNRALEL